MSTPNLVSCPCIYCKGKHVSRYIRRHHMSQNFTTAAQGQSSIAIPSQLLITANYEFDSSSKGLEIDSSGVKYSPTADGKR